MCDHRYVLVVRVGMRTEYDGNEGEGEVPFVIKRYECLDCKAEMPEEWRIQRQAIDESID